MRCDKCGHEELALKTCRRRDDAERRGVLCDECWEPVRHLVWVVAGPFTVTARCDGCWRYFNPRELVPATLRAGGYKRDVWTGLCPSCVSYT